MAVGRLLIAHRGMRKELQCCRKHPCFINLLDFAHICSAGVQLGGCRIETQHKHWLGLNLRVAVLHAAANAFVVEFPVDVDAVFSFTQRGETTAYRFVGEVSIPGAAFLRFIGRPN